MFSLYSKSNTLKIANHYYVISYSECTQRNATNVFTFDTGNAIIKC